MSSETHVAELLSRWQERQAQGEELSVSALCRDCPELIPAVARRVEALRRMQPMGPVAPQPTTLPGGGTASAFATQPPADGAGERGTPIAPTVAGYEILGELGRGGMGVVYRARQTRLGRTVALKMILAGGHAGAAERERFRTEAEAIARLQHPNIVQVFEVGEQGGLPYFSLEFCGGGSLAQQLAGTPLPPRRAATVVEQLARAMQVAHDKGVLHRDLKPANVLLAEDGTPKITDFGLAKKLDEAGQTATGAVMGTPSYMAPEQAGGKSQEIGPACDIYALGAILYECLTGRPPFRAATAADTVMQVLTREPVPPRQLNASVPRDLETICLKCLQKQRGDRYATADAVADDLARFRRGEPTRARPIGVMGRAWRWCKRHPLPTALLSLGVVIGVALPRFASTGTSTDMPSAADALPIAVELWPEAEDALATAGMVSPFVVKYRGAEVEFWLEIVRDGKTEQFVRLATPDVRGAEPGDAPGAISGYFIWTRGETRDDGWERWTVAIKRADTTKETSGMAVTTPALDLAAWRFTGTNGSGTTCLRTSYRPWHGPDAIKAVQPVVAFAPPNLTSAPAFAAVWNDVHIHARESTWFGSLNVDNCCSHVEIPFPTDRPVCVRECKRSRKCGEMVLEEFTVRVMCQVLARKE